MRSVLVKGQVGAEQLRRWLLPRGDSSVSVAEMEQILGADVCDMPPASRSTLAFALAVLRDVYTDDADVLDWLMRCRPELDGRCAVDALLAGNGMVLEPLVVREWNLPRKRGSVRLRYVRQVRLT